MQNSAWKLTAMAGVIGLGFLIVLQAQRGMQDGQESDTELAETGGQTADGNGKLSQTAAEDDGFLSQNQEPGMDSSGSAAIDVQSSGQADVGIPDFANRPVQAGDLPQQSRFAPEFTGFTATAGTGDTALVIPAVGTTEEENPFAVLPAAIAAETTPAFDELQVVGETDSQLIAGTDVPGLLFSESAEPEAGLVEPAPAVEEEPFLLSPATTGQATDLLPQESTDASKQRALELIAAAGRAVDEGELETARELAVAALELPVSYDPLETHPDALLREIDQLIRYSNLPQETAVAAVSAEPQPVLLTGGELEANPFGQKPVEELSGEPPALLEKLPFQSEVKSAMETVTTEVSGTPATGVSGDATIPLDGPEPTLRPELTIEKIAPEEATLDEPMVYSINVKNRGQATAVGLVVEDRVPKGCRLVGTRPQAVMVGTKLIWRLGRLPAGESESILVKVVPISQGEIGSVATVSFVTEVAARTEVRTTPESSLQLNVAVEPQATLGESLTLKFHIANNGQTAAQNVRLQNIIPEGLEHSTGADLTYDVGTIEAGKSFSADLELLAVKAGTFVNLATISADGGLQSESTAEIRVNAAAPLTLNAVAGKPAFVGRNAAATTRVTNDSRQLVDPFIVTSRLPAEVQFVSATENGQYDAAAHSVVWQVPDLKAGASRDLQTVFKARSFGTHTVLTRLDGSGQSTGPVDARLETDITVRGIAALAIDLANVPATVLTNEEFTIDATVLNRGTGPDTEVTFQLLLPPGLEYVSSRGPVKIQQQPITLTSGVGMTAVASSAIPEVGSQASLDFQITLRASGSGRPKIRAQVNSSEFSEPVATEAAIVVIDDTP